MTEHFPGPYELRIFYVADFSPGGALTHQQRMSLILDADPDVGETFDNIVVKLAGGGTDTLDNVLDGWRNVIEDFLSAASTTFTHAELWKYVAGSYEATYVATQDISAAATSGSAARAAAESIWTMRTRGGGIMRVSLLDTISAPADPSTYADSNADNQALWDFLTDPVTGPFVARDDSYPVAPLRVFPGQNEHVFKKRYGRLG